MCELNDEVTSNFQPRPLFERPDEENHDRDGAQKGPSIAMVISDFEARPIDEEANNREKQPHAVYTDCNI